MSRWLTRANEKSEGPRMHADERQSDHNSRAFVFISG